MSLAKQLKKHYENVQGFKAKGVMTDAQAKEYLEEKSRKAVVECIEDLVNLTNSGEIDADMICDGLHRPHRYLQGEFMEILVKALDKYSVIDVATTDPRNELAKKTAARMYKGAMG